MKKQMICCTFILLMQVSSIHAESLLDMSIGEDDTSTSDLIIRDNSNSLLPSLFKSEEELTKQKQVRIEEMLQDNPVWRKQLLEENKGVTHHWEREDARWLNQYYMIRN